MHLAPDRKRYSEIKELAKANNVKTVYYAVHTGWWSFTLPYEKNGLPVDPRGSVLYESNDLDEFFKAVEQHPAHCGKHGLEAFAAAFHGNVLTEDNLPTSFDNWIEYNNLLDKGI